MSCYFMHHLYFFCLNRAALESKRTPWPSPKQDTLATLTLQSAHFKYFYLKNSPIWASLTSQSADFKQPWSILDVPARPVLGVGRTPDPLVFRQTKIFVSQVHISHTTKLPLWRLKTYLQRGFSRNTTLWKEIVSTFQRQASKSTAHKEGIRDNIKLPSATTK